MAIIIFLVFVLCLISDNNMILAYKLAGTDLNLKLAGMANGFGRPIY